MELNKELDIIYKKVSTSLEYDIKSKDRIRIKVIGRAIFCQIAREMTNATYQDLADYLDIKKHSTIIHSVKNVFPNLKRHYVFIYKMIKQELGEPLIDEIEALRLRLRHFQDINGTFGRLLHDLTAEELKIAYDKLEVAVKVIKAFRKDANK